MALSITKVATLRGGQFFKGRQIRLIKFVGDTDIPAAGTGYTLTASLLGFSSAIEGGITGAETTGVYFTTFDPATGAFRWFNADDAVEAAAGENGVDTKIAYGIFIGY